MNKKILSAYETDSSRIKGKALDVVHPETIDEVKRLVDLSKRIVPRGGGTGLAGGCVPQEGVDLVIDVSKLDKLGSIDKERATIEVEAGVILDDLQEYLGKQGLEFPINPSSHAVCTIGGMISTNAVGSRALKYGRTSNWVKWVDVVDGNGEISRKGITELSDYSGMEGTTGIIVRACLKISPLKKRTATLLKTDNLDELVSIVKDLKKNANVSMIEFLDKKVSELLNLGRFYNLVIEYEDDSGTLDGVKYNNLLATRDKAYPILSREGYTRIEDPKILIDKFEILMRWFEKHDIPVFGHISVGILHPCFSEGKEELIPEMMEFVKRLGGQVSGEHGIGLLKKQFVEFNDRKILTNVKKRTDPGNKFNVGKVI